MTSEMWVNFKMIYFKNEIFDTPRLKARRHTGCFCLQSTADKRHLGLLMGELTKRLFLIVVNLVCPL